MPQGPWEKYKAPEAAGPWEKYGIGEFADVQSGSSTTAGPFQDVKSGASSTAADWLHLRYPGLPSMADIGAVAKGAVGLPEDLSSLKNIKLPGLMDTLRNGPIAPGNVVPVNPSFVINQLVQQGKALGSGVMDAPANFTSKEPYRIGQGINTVLQIAALADTGKGMLEDTLGSKQGAAAKFERISKTAGDQPVDTTAADKALAKALENRRLGGEPMSPAMKAYKNIRQPTEAISGAPEGFPSETAPAPLTYDEAFKLASNAKKSSAHASARLSASMKAINSEFIDALQTGNRAAAETKGLGFLFDEAMPEYAKAMSRDAALVTAVKYGKRAALLYAAGKIFGAAIGHGAGSLVDSITGR